METKCAFITRRHALLPEIVIALLLTGLGLTVTCGWLLHVPAMVEIRAGLVPMVFNTGLCFFLSGCAILLMKSNAPRARFARQSMGASLLLLCGATFIELLFDRSLGIDLAALHAWHDYGNTRPGRMAPNTALGFMLIGAIIMLADRVVSRRQALIVVLLNAALLTIGLTGLVGYLLAPDLLYGWARSARMALHTATGMILSTISLWLTWSKSDWYMSRRYFREDEKIRFLGSAILVVVAVTVGLIGFVLLQATLEKSLEAGLTNIVRNRAPWFDATVNNAARHASTAVRLSSLDEASKAWLSAPSTQTQMRLAQISRRLIEEGFRGIALQDGQGKPLQAYGQFNTSPEIAAPLDKENRSYLVWDKEMVLRTQLLLKTQNGKTLRLALDVAAPRLNAALFDAARLGESGEIGACIAKGEMLLCFPGNRHDAPFMVKQRIMTGRPLPVEYALAGKSGVVYTLDYRGQNVTAAYGALAPSLGFVAKQDTKEAYAPIRQALEIGAPVILLVAVLGAVLLYSQLSPLATRMRESELKLTKQAQYDSLTGLPNRLLFMDMLRTAVLRSKRSGNAMALMFIDLDGFKQVNDTLGHQAGDELLIQFAQRLASQVRRTDTVAR